MFYFNLLIYKNITVNKQNTQTEMNDQELENLLHKILNK